VEGAIAYRYGAGKAKLETEQSANNKPRTKPKGKAEDKSKVGSWGPPQTARYTGPIASRNWRFITLPLALRGSGSLVSTMVSGTL
jgi:hypothetical protein